MRSTRVTQLRARCRATAGHACRLARFGRVAFTREACLAPIVALACGVGFRLAPCVPAGLLARDRDHRDAIDRAGRHAQSQPVQSSAIIVCICLAAPMIASTGHACMHSVQPMQRLSSMIASGRGRSTPFSGLSAMTGMPSRIASRATPSSPPGGHWLYFASPRRWLRHTAGTRDNRTWCIASGAAGLRSGRRVSWKRLQSLQSH